MEEWGEWEWEMAANNTNSILPDSIDIRIRRLDLRHGVQLLSSAVAASSGQDLDQDSEAFDLGLDRL